MRSPCTFVNSHLTSRCLFLFNRSSKNSFITPATGRMVDICARGGTSMVTPRFDSRFVNRENKHISLLSLIQPALHHLCHTTFSDYLDLKQKIWTRFAVSKHLSLLTCCFRVFKTPGLRTPALHERVYTISANGSPLADTGDAVLTLPLGGGEVIPAPSPAQPGLEGCTGTSGCLSSFGSSSLVSLAVPLLNQ